jgi:hypothetical protein
VCATLSLLLSPSLSSPALSLSLPAGRYGVGQNPIYLERMEARTAKKEKSGQAAAERAEKAKAESVGRLFDDGTRRTDRSRDTESVRCGSAHVPCSGPQSERRGPSLLTAALLMSHARLSSLEQQRRQRGSSRRR